MSNGTNDTTVAVNGSNVFVYPSTAGAEIIELPKFGGSRGEVETVQIQFVGRHVANRVEQAFRNTKGLEYRDVSKSDPVKALSHYAGAAKGAGLLDEASSSKMTQLSRAMADSSDPERFYTDEVRTFLLELGVRGR